MDLTELDVDIFPALKAFKSAEEMAEKCFLKIYEYQADRRGWYGDYLLDEGENLPAIVHGFVNVSLLTKVAKMGKIKCVKFHHAKKVGSQDAIEPWLEVWIDEEN